MLNKVRERYTKVWDIRRTIVECKYFSCWNTVGIAKGRTGVRTGSFSGDNQVEQVTRRLFQISGLLCKNTPPFTTNVDSIKSQSNTHFSQNGLSILKPMSRLFN